MAGRRAGGKGRRNPPLKSGMIWTQGDGEKENKKAAGADLMFWEVRISGFGVAGDSEGLENDRHLA